MIALFIAFALVFLLTLLAAPTLGSGWLWDLGNGLGFAAFAGLLYLTASGRLLRDPRAHRLIGQRGVDPQFGHLAVEEGLVV